jgi:hypothetical protein
MKMNIDNFPQHQRDKYLYPGIPDWAIAEIVRAMLTASEPTCTRARIIMDAAYKRSQEVRNG